MLVDDNQLAVLDVHPLDVQMLHVLFQ